MTRELCRLSLVKTYFSESINLKCVQLHEATDSSEKMARGDLEDRIRK